MGQSLFPWEYLVLRRYGDAEYIKYELSMSSKWRSALSKQYLVLPAPLPLHFTATDLLSSRQDGSKFVQLLSILPTQARLYRGQYPGPER